MPDATVSGPDPLIHIAFSGHAAARPDAPALIHEGAELSYATLDAAADAYAAELSARGVTSHTIVPLLLPRSPQLVAVELAVLKCGAAYANIDPSWPAARQSVNIRQIAPKVVVCPDGAVPDCDADVVALAPERVADAAMRASGFTPAAVDASDPATVFFTSGTTGVPKGVVIPHRAVTRLFGADGLTGFGPGHVTPQAAAIAWDMYAFELWGQLLTGGAVAFVPDGFLMPGTLRELVRTAGVDTVWLTTSLFNLLVDEDVDCFAGIGWLLTGGEKISTAHVRAFLSSHPDVPLRNGYGPAENCMVTTTRLIQPQDCEMSGGIPVGSPVPGTTVVILDEDDLPCPTGVRGEVCTAGSGLAVGYLGQPEMTAAKFPTLRIGDEPVRVYRTGDMGVLDDEGVLHFRGRRDRQVKISGYRIEPAEIEIAALRIDGLRQCAVLPLTAPDGRVSALALCYVADSEASSGARPLAEAAVKRTLAQMLPAYLVPGVVRRFDRFPLTANGKVDHAELALAATAPSRSGR
jgi:D-alanine--poly(phosphoribitol) ligase subunit 1